LLNDSIGWAVGSFSFRHDLALEVPTIVSTLDGGASWKASLLFPMSLRDPPEYDECGDFSFYDASHGCLIAKTFQDHTPVLLSTSDGGITWQRCLESSSGLSTVLMYDSIHGWAGGAYGSFHILTDRRTEIRTQRAHQAPFKASVRADIIGGNYLLDGKRLTGNTVRGVAITPVPGRKKTTRINFVR
jgi:hypothetical protein